MKKSMLWLTLVVALSLIVLPGCSAMNLLPAQTVRASAPVPVVAPTPMSAETVPPTKAGTLADLEGTLERIYEDVSPSVVSIQVIQKQTVGMGLPGMLPELPFFGQPSPQQPPQEQYQQGSGSGFVWDKEGHIVTNNHVVEGADKIKVMFSDGTTVSGKVVGTDPDSDLAVVKVELPAAQLHPVQLADSTQVKVGQLAVAIGNPFGLENTMTVGFVSALGRSLPVESESIQGPSYTIPDIIQTDASVNPGNSGGILVDDEGQVIGVTAAIASPVRASAGIGFAIPSAIVQKVVPVLIEKGRYAHPWLGISGTSLDPDLAQAMKLKADQHGALVVDVTPDGPADKAGLRGSDQSITVDGEERRIGGDVIVAINGQPVENFDDLVTYLVRSTEVGEKITLTVLRDGREQQVEVTLNERPSSQKETQPTAGETAAEGVWLGITGMTLSPEVAQAMSLSQDQQGVLVEEVVNGSPADKAGLRRSYKPVTIKGQRLLVGGDVIVAWDGQPVTQMEELKALTGEASAGQEITLTVLRDGEQTQVQVTLAERPGTTP
ncbi:MAG: trypsin-like peptidase domain-containing protein [Anaerolineae bacterium]|nr:trypsin-like peptidase domain-containing protein [Anaerolineae bacterium]